MIYKTDKKEDEDGYRMVVTGYRKNEHGDLELFVTDVYVTDEYLPREVLERIFEEEYQERVTPNDIQN